MDYLENKGFEAIHWSSVGKINAKDIKITQWARENDYTIFTNDLDFGRILALTHAEGPSVLQIRGNMLLPEDCGDMVLTALKYYQKEVRNGALITLDEVKWRIKILPIKPLGRTME